MRTSPSYIWELENRNPATLAADKILKVAAALGVTADFLLDEEQEELLADVVDQLLFRMYQRLDSDTKRRIR